VIGRRSLLLAGAALPASAYGQCVINSPAADACRGGVRNAGPAGQTLDLNFMFPGSLDSRVTFTRASTATYTDASGTIQTAAINAPRWDYAGGVLRGLLIEEARTNLFLNSATLGTQGVTVTAQAYTLSFYGAGTVTKSGVATGALVGTGAGQRVSQTFTPTAGTVTCTVTGSVMNAQLEAGSWVTSWVPTTGATATRAQDFATMPVGGTPWFVTTTGTWFAEFILTSPTVDFGRVIGVLPGPGSPSPLFVNGAGNAGSFDGIIIQTANTMTSGTLGKAASAFGAGTGKICLNGGAVVSAAQNGQNFATAAFLQCIAGTASTENASGYIRRVSYWPRSLSNAELQSVTT